MAAIGSLFVLLGLETSKFKKGTRETQRSIDRFANKAQRKFDTVGRSVERNTAQVQVLKRSMIALAAATASIGLVAKSFISAASEAEQFGVRLKVILGSAEEGGKVFREMAAFASKVPFEYKQILDAATQLAGVLKGGSDEIKQVMPLIADLAATSGLSIQKTTEQVIRMFSAGAASADLFRERGILAMLGFQAGVTVSAEETRLRMIEAWESPTSKFRGATKELATTWTGLMSMLSDKWFQFRNQVMNAGIFSFVKAMVAVIDSDLGTALDNNTARAKAWSDTLIAGIKSVIKGVVILKSSFAGLELIWVGLKMAWLNVVIFIAEQIKFLDKITEDMINKVLAIIPGISAKISTGQREQVAEIGRMRGILSDLTEQWISLGSQKGLLNQLEKVDLFLARVQERFVQMQAPATGGIGAAAGAATPAGAGGPAAELGAGSIGNLDVFREQLTGRVELLQTSLLSEEEKLTESFERKLEIINEGWMAGIISTQELMALEQGLTAQHQEKLRQIEIKSLTARQKFEALTMKKRVTTVIGSLAQMTAGVAQSNKAMFQANKIFSIADAIINTIRGVTQALAAYPPPLSFGMAAAVAAVGFAQVNAIKSTSFGGGGAVGTFAAAPATGLPFGGGEATPGTQPGVGTPAAAATQVNITIEGQSFSREQMLELIDGLNDALGDGAELAVTA